MHVKYLIIGAGPTGLGAAHRLRELGENSFVVLESNNYPGGLSASFKDGAGYTWDVGGHVIFSHYPYFDNLLDDLLAGNFLSHLRKAFIRLLESWIPYPFQNNIRYLPPNLIMKCLEGLLEARDKKLASPKNFSEWILAVFGSGIADIFMYPYNFKVWATPAEKMAWNWIGDRVSVVDFHRVLKNVVYNQDDVAWGPNNTFRFPLSGGTGEIFRLLAARLEDKIFYASRAVKINPLTKEVFGENGQVYTFDFLLFTGALDLLCLDILSEAGSVVRDAAKLLFSNGAIIYGFGVAGRVEDDKCWMYFPESNSPFYRVTNLHNYSPRNVPDWEGQQALSRALMAEVSFSKYKPENETSLPGQVERALAASGLMKGVSRDVQADNVSLEAIIKSRFVMKIERAYPVPTLERDGVLKVIRPYLEDLSIFARGRFGGWKYEVGNMDHSVMQGVEWAERMVLGTSEKTYS